MNRLNRDARALVERARDLHEPTARDRLAVRRALALKLPAAAVATTVITQSVAAAAAGGASSGLRAVLVVKWLFGGVMLGSLGVGLATLEARAPAKSLHAASLGAQVERPRSAAPRAPAARGAVPEPIEASANEEKSREVKSARPVVANSVVAAPAPPATFTPVEVAVTRSAASFPTPAAQVAHGEPAPNAATRAAQTPDELLREARALRAAQAALRDGRPEDALELIRVQSLQFPSGGLKEERSAARLIALCALGRTDTARVELARFLESAQNSPLAPRVRAACAKR